jgi:hypothetical protein
MSKLNMFETLSKVRVRIYLIFNFSSDDSDPELRPQSFGFRTLPEHKTYFRHVVLFKTRGHTFVIRI